MNIYAVGINHRTAPVAIREKLSLRPDEQGPFLTTLLQLPGLEECVVLSTCNRTEVYGYGREGELGSHGMEKALCDFKKVERADYKPYFYVYHSLDAVRHLFKVAAGLDSLIFAEDQIVGQVKQAQQTAWQAGSSKTVMNTLFREAVVVAKQIRQVTHRSGKPVSVAAAAVKVAQEHWGNRLRHKNALLIGAGKLSWLVAEQLLAAGIGTIWLAARSSAPALEIAARDSRIRHVDYAGRYQRVDQADLIVSMTCSPHYTLTREQLEPVLMTEKERILIDLAVPRDLDETVRELPGVRYFNIDQLPEEGREYRERQQLEMLLAEQILDDQVIAFANWAAFRQVTPLLRRVQDQARDYLAWKVEETLSQLKTASDAEKRVVRKAMQNLTGYLLNQWIRQAKQSVAVTKGHDGGPFLEDAPGGRVEHEN